MDSSRSIGAPRVGGEGLAAAVVAAGRALERLADALDEHGPGPRDGADQASALAALREENRQLREALESRGSIERAKGVLMAHRKCSERDAFGILTALARREQRKVRVIADELLGSLAIAAEADPAP